MRESSSTRSAARSSSAVRCTRPPSSRMDTPHLLASSFSENSSTVAAKMSTDTMTVTARASVDAGSPSMPSASVAPPPASCSNCSAFLMAMNATIATPKRLAMSNSRNITRKDMSE